MSIQSTSYGSGSGFNYNAIRERKQPPDLTKDQLTKIEQKMKANGQDTTNIDKVISNFDQLDTDKSGKVSAKEIQAGAQQFGIQLPQGHHHHHGGGGAEGAQSAQNAQPFFGGPPPGLISNDPGNGQSQSGDASQNNTSSYLTQLLQSFGQSNPASSWNTSSISAAA